MIRIDREKRVIGIMIGMYCRKHHQIPAGKQLCDRCSALRSYAFARMEHCPTGDAKTSCRKCKIHCYASSRRDEIRAIMRYAGPRMLLHHPIAAIRHLLDELK